MLNFLLIYFIDNLLYFYIYLLDTYYYGREEGVVVENVTRDGGGGMWSVYRNWVNKRYFGEYLNMLFCGSYSPISGHYLKNMEYIVTYRYRSKLYKICLHPGRMPTSYSDVPKHNFPNFFLIELVESGNDKTIDITDHLLKFAGPSGTFYTEYGFPKPSIHDINKYTGHTLENYNIKIINQHMETEILDPHQFISLL